MRAVLIVVLVLMAAEIWSIGEVSRHIGGLATFILLLGDGIVGLQLMRSRGIQATMQRVQAIQPGESPMPAIAEGILRAFAGILLIVPGFVSDIVALIILLPFVRKRFAHRLSTKGLFQGFVSGSFSKTGFGHFGGAGAGDNFAGGNVYEHDGSARDQADKVDGQSTNVIDLKPINKP